MAGFPCSPFSQQRADRFTGVAGWRARPQAAVMFSVATDIRTRQPFLAILEHVNGLVMASKQDSGLGPEPSAYHADVMRDSPLDAPCGRRCVRVLVWVPLRLPRTAKE